MGCRLAIAYRDAMSFNERGRRTWVAARAAELQPGARLLDAGAGSGPYRDLFAHCEYRAHDFGKEPSTRGRYTDLDYVSDITDIPVDAGSFDAVLCTEVLEHVPDPAAAVGEFARILRPGGTVLITAPLGSILHQEPYHYYGGFTPHWYEKFLTEAGFVGVQVDSNMGFFSLFAQEAQRFHALIRRGRPRTRLGRLALVAIWLPTLPVFRLILPLLGRYLDRLDLERVATVGYHVRATRAGGEGS